MQLDENGGSNVEPERMFRELAQVARRALPDGVAPELDQRGLRRLQDRLQARRRRAWLTGWRLLVPTTALAAGLAAAVALRMRVDYQIHGGAEVADGTIAPAGAGAPTVRFSDGTEVVLDREARGRVAEVGLRGARMALEDGRARVKVAKRPRARWSFDAGPYRVLVTGTAFDLRWSRRERRLDLDLHSGSVTVHGPATGAGVQMVAGQRMVALPDQHRVDVGPAGVAGAPSGPRIVPLPSPARPIQAAPPAERPVDRAAPRPQAPVSWARRIAAGDHEGVLRDAERRGMAQALASVSSADLAALSDAARYAGRNDVARRALVAQRQRFAGTPRASDAAFLLGRLAEDAAGDPDEALRWYDRYLDESADGSYSAEALGRKMTVVKRVSGRERACGVAREYLERYPSGPYARVARGMCR